ncbi:hypothetical protein D8674_025607 [Pyrus ussuriensis x Pyrus communis]|uniref:Uncharacterized protein n=1 Tax=Pyrus ussuriensis x Pyrus communis TaxID=2448454 RepID=A0A5N5I7D4_9ROSA|nr:hypothetical protein D8674_025607 [Pyrus ussuriensis x Pyrus communis]
MTLTTVDDEYSKAMLGKQLGKGSEQSVLDQKFDFRFRLIAFFLIVLQVCLVVEVEHFEKVVCGIQKADVVCEDCGQILSKKIRLSKFGERAMSLRFLSKQSCWECFLGCEERLGNLANLLYLIFFSSSFLRMSGPSDSRLDLNAVEEVAMSPQDNIWRPSFICPTGPLTNGDFVMKNDMTATVVAKNLLTPKDKRLLSKRSDELAVKDSLAFSVQCAVESLAAKVISLKQEIRGLKHENKQLHMLAYSYATNMKRKLDQLQESKEDSGIALHHLQMSESGSPSDEDSPSSSSRFELAMLESSGPLLESCTKETLDDFRNCQTLANIGSSSFMSVGEGVVFDAIPIFRSEFTANLLEKNLLDSERQLKALRQSCSIPRSVGMRLVHHEELPFKPSKDHVMFYTQILLTLGVKLPLHPWLQRMLSFIEYVPRQLNPGFWDTLIGFYIIWMECGLGEPSFHQWRYRYKMRPVKTYPGYVECACNIKLSGRELADVEKVLRVSKEDRHLGKLRPLFRKYSFQPLVSECQRRAKRKAPMLVPIDDILFHKGARKHRVRPAPRPKSQEVDLKITTSKRAEVEAIGCAAAIVAREERRLLPLLSTIDPIFSPTMESTDQEGDPSSSRKRKYKEEPSSFRYVNNCLAGRRSTVDELGEPLDENESDRDRMMRLSSYVMTEYDDRLREVERYKATFKENNQLVNNAKKMSKALAENVRLKKQLEGTGKQLEIIILKVSKVKGELDSALVEVSELKRISQAFQDAFKPHCIRVANFEKRKWIVVLEHYDNGSIIQKGEAFILEVDPSSEDDSDNEASVDEQSQESEDGFGDTEDCGDGDAIETQSDIVKGLASDEDDSYFKPERFNDRDVRELGPSCLNHLLIELMSNGLHYIGCRMAVAQHLYSVSLLMAKGLAIRIPELFWTRTVACSSSTRTTASVPKASENGVFPVEVRYEVRTEHPKLLVVELSPIVHDYRIRNAKSAKDVLPYKVFYFCLSNGCQGLYFSPLCEVADQIKSPLGEWPKADHSSKRLGREVMNSCIALTLIT